MLWFKITMIIILIGCVLACYASLVAAGEADEEMGWK
jgi:uncharacterized BrkB/YihY/UPF0761 family membrane protein